MSDQSNAPRERRRFARTLALLAVSLVAWPAATAEAQDRITWSGSTSTLWTTGGNWFGGTAPSGTTNIAVFDSAGTYASGTQATFANSALSLNGIVVGNISSNLLITSASNTFTSNNLTINGLGIDMSNAGADFTLAPGGVFTMNSGTINVQTGRTLTVTRNISSGGYSSAFSTGITTVTGAGTVRFLQRVQVSSGANLNIEGGTFAFSSVGSASNVQGFRIDSAGVMRVSNATVTSNLGEFSLVSGTFVQNSGTTTIRFLLRHMHVVCAHLSDGVRQAVIVQSHAGSED